MAATADEQPPFAALAGLALGTAVRLQPGQDLMVTAPLEAAPLVRELASLAYRRGARAVACVYDDPALVRARLAEGSDAALDHAAPWLPQAVAEALRSGAGLLRVLGPCPDLLEGITPARILRAHAGAARADVPAGGCALPFATTAWATRVLPQLAPAQAVARLWQQLSEALRLDAADPCAAWREHLAALAARRAALQAQGFTSLHIRDAHTDLRVGLAPHACWHGGEALPSLPWEELGVALDGRSAQGHVRFVRPLALGGTLVQGLRAEFRDGCATWITADSGTAQAQGLFAAEATRRLHAIGLVPTSSRVARQQTLFCVPLLDRQAASHLGFGPAASLRIECMFGSATTDIDGLWADGRSAPLVRGGEFVLGA
jgi:aminopeptidase